MMRVDHHAVQKSVVSSRGSATLQQSGVFNSESYIVDITGKKVAVEGSSVGGTAASTVAVAGSPGSNAVKTKCSDPLGLAEDAIEVSERALSKCRIPDAGRDTVITTILDDTSAHVEAQSFPGVD